MQFILVLGAHHLLGAVFVISGIPKLLRPRQTIADVQNYNILPRSLAMAFGWVIGPTELLIGLSLLSGYGAREGALLALALLASFMGAVGIAMARGQDLNCSCFGLLYRERVGWSTQLRDALLCLLATVVIVWSHSVPTVGTMLSGGTLTHIVGVITGILVLMFAMALGWVASKGWPHWIGKILR